jgi:hypothetical protein
MAILATQKVLTLDFWKYARHLQVGDYVFDKDGNPVKVKLVQEYLAPVCYEVTFNDHLTAAGDEHLAFMAETPKYRKRISEYKGVQQFRRPLKPLAVRDLLELPLKTKYNRTAYSVPTSKPINFPHQDLPVPPFIFGYWFFNRRKDKSLKFTHGMQEEITQIFRDHGYKVKVGRKVNPQTYLFTTTPTVESQLIPLIPTKIPFNYLFSSIEQRLELLRGIIFSKARQYSQKEDTFRVTSRSYTTITQIQNLAESLGCKTKIEHKPQLENYTVFFKCRYPIVPNQVSPPVKVHQARRHIVDIEPIPAQSCIHVETEGKDNTILVGEGFIPCR